MKKIFYIFILLLPTLAHAQPTQYITTIAGTGSYGFFGDNGNATAAELAKPNSVCLDKWGNVFFIDMYNQRVRKITPSGIITTVAGRTDTPGFSGDGGPATNAKMDFPTGLAVDTAGNIFIAEYNHQRIRKVNTAGIINTYAGNGTAAYTGDGGQATAAGLWGPFGIAVDDTGNIYFSEYSNAVIRKVTPAGIISTVAGVGGSFGYSGDGGAATSALTSLKNPKGVAVDKFGNIYIADASNIVIRKVTASTGFISTIAGIASTIGVSGDGGMATNAEMYYPISVSVDDSGNVYTADFNNNRIRVITPNGFIKTIAGSVAGFADGVANTAGLMNSPIGTAVDAVGNIYVADYLNNRIRKITPMYCKPHAGTISGGVQICPCSPIKYSNTLTGGTWSVKTGHASINPTTGWTHAVTAGIDTVVYTLTDTCGTASVAYAITLLDSAICDSMKNIVGKKYVCLDTTYSNYKFTVGVAGGTWSSSGIYATVNDTGLVHAVSAGYDTIKYTIVDSCGTTIKTYPIRVLTKLQCDTANSVNEIANQDAMFISIFPNPATQSITINANNIIYPSCTIINYLGVVVDRITLTTNETNIGIQQLPTGMYYIRFVGKHGIDVRKFVKE